MYNKSILYIILAAFTAGFGLWAAQNLFNKQQVKPAPALQTVRMFSQAREIPDFALQTASGETVNKAYLGKHWTMVFLGFTHCPDVCPTTLGELSKAQKTWEDLPESTRPRLLFVSVDPARDTPKAIAEYAAFFHKDTLTATAQEPALADFAQSIALVYAKVPMDNGDYTMDHSATIVVLNPLGNEVGIIRPPFVPEKIAADFIALSKDSQENP
ncbi:MAG: SCO family protein [Arenimonas sp.]